MTEPLNFSDTLFLKDLTECKQCLKIPPKFHLRSCKVFASVSSTSMTLPMQIFWSYKAATKSELLAPLQHLELLGAGHRFLSN